MPPRAARPEPAHERLFAHFRKVHEGNGAKSYREIARSMLGLSGSSHSRVGEFLNGSALPRDAKQAQAFVKALGGSAEDIARAEKLMRAARISWAARKKPGSCAAEEQSGPGPSADGMVAEGIWGVLRRHAEPAEVEAVEEMTARSTASESAGGQSEPAAAEHAERLLDLVARLLGPDLERLGVAEAVLLIVAAHQHTAAAGDTQLHSLPFRRLARLGAKWREAIGALVCGFRLPTHELRGESFDSIPGLSADLRFCAVLLRIADLLDVSDDRPPTAVCGHLGSGAEPTMTYSGRLNMGGLSLPSARTAGYAIELFAEPDHPAAEHALRRHLDDVDSTLLRCRALQHQFQAGWQGFSLPGKVSRDRIEPHAYKYGEFRFELDRAAVLELFMGEQLYGEPYVFIRELLQNSFDAVRLRRLLHGPDERDRVAVTCWQDDCGYLWVRIDDDGIGMDEYALLNFFLRVGRSYYRSPELQAELLRRGKAGEDFRPISRFGIGVLSCFIVADRVEVSTRRRYPDDAEATALRLSLHRDEDFFVLREAGMPVDPMPGATAEDRARYRDRCGTSLAVRVDPLRARITVEGVTEALERYLFCPPVPVTFNSEPIGLITEDMVRRPWVPVPRVVDVAAADRRFESTQLPYLGPLRIALVPLDLTRYSATPLLRGQLLSCHVVEDLEHGELGERADLLVGLRFPAGDRELAEVRELLSTAVVGWTCLLVCQSRRWQDEDPSPGRVDVTVTRRVVKAAVDKAVELLEQAGYEPCVGDMRSGDVSPGELLHALHNMRESDSWRDRFHLESPTGSVSSPFEVSWAVLRGPGDLGSLPTRDRWLGHNGIAVPQSLSERDRFRMSGGWFELAPRHINVCGVVALTDILRPDVSVARDEVRGVPFGAHSALQLAVRRAVAAYDGGPFADFVAPLRSADMLEIPPAERFSASALQDDLLRGGAWDAEPVISGHREILSVDQIRGRVAGGEPVAPRLAGVPGERRGEWIRARPGHEDETPFAFGEIIGEAVAHHRLNLAVPQQREPYDDEDSDEWWDEDPDEWWEREARLVVVDDRLPCPRPEVDAFPPLTFLPCQEPTERIRFLSGVWNIDHPVIAWLLDHVGALQRDLPVCYDQLRTVLAAENETGDEAVDKAAIGELLEQIARFRPDLTPPLDR
ncbi:HD domain-containing protein [Streptomyces sp. NPDC002643]